MPIIKKTEFIDAQGIIKDQKDIQKAILETANTVKELTKINASLVEQSKKLQTATRNVNKEGSGAEAKTRIDLTKQLDTATAKLVASQTKEAQELAKLRVLTQQQNKVLKDQAKEALNLTNEYEKQSKRLNELRRNVKAKTLEYEKGRKALGLSRKEYKQLRSELKANSKEVINLDKNLKRIDSKFGQSQRFVGQYGNALKGIGTQLLGAAGIVGGVQLLVDGFQKFNETANQVNDITRKLGTNFGIFGSQAKEIAADINAIATTFDEDYNEVLETANSVSKQFGITAQEATRLIEEGFLKGSNNTKEFLSIAGETSTRLADAGISAEQAFAIINRQVTEGIYSDKGTQAIAEAAQRLRENTKAVQDALSPLDESIKKQIEQEIAAGNSFKAVQLVSQALKDSSLTAQEAQTIIADVFGGEGEEAGRRYLELISDIDTNLENVSIQSSDAEQASLNLSKSWNRFVAGVSDSDGIFGKVFARLKNLLAGAINSLTLLIDKLSGGDKAVDRIKNAVERLKQKQDELSKSNDDNSSSLTRNTNATTTNAAAQRKRQAEIEKQNRALEKQIRLQSQRLQSLSKDVQKSEAPEDTDAFFTSIDETLEVEQERGDKILEFQDKLNADRLEREKLYQEALKELSLSTVDEISGIFSEGIQQDAQFKIDAAKQSADREKEILKQQLQDGAITEEQFRQKSEELDKKANRESAKIQRQSSLYQIGVDTAAGIVKALASSAPPANFINAGLIAAQGALQAALVAAKPLPSFKTGVIGFKGKGSDTSDSNTVRISNNESVITAKGTRNAPLALSAINSGLMTDADVIKGGILKNTAPKQYNFDRLLKEQQKTNSLLGNSVSTIDNGEFVKVIYANGQTNIYPKK